MYNEESGAEKCVRAVSQVLQTQLPDVRLYAVNDGSSDKTLSILKRLASEGYPLEVINHEQNKGYGAAILTGARAAHKDGFEFGLFMDSDLTNDPNLIPTFYHRLNEGTVDLIKASRYIQGGGMQGVPFKRQIITILGNKVASSLFQMGINDCTNGFRAVRLSLISDLQFKERGFPSIIEELYYLKLKGARALEIPYILTSRQDDRTSKFRYDFNTFYTYFKYAFKAFLSRSNA